jgi:penicillin G amidase
VTGEIYRDAWGIPHLRAGGAVELARLQGRVTAHDRAWQLDVERHRAQGTSASFLGAEALSWDRLVRRARIDDTARRCFAELERRDPETAVWVRAYVDGVNEGLAEGARRAPEFTTTRLAPGRWEPWTPLGVWLSVHLVFAGFPAKLWREQVVRHLGADAVGLFATDGPGTSGSNGWLVGGERTVTGRAIIAGDPHRFIEDPGIYQQIHLSCPEFDVVGLAVPGIPGIAHFGHTGTVAWAITNAMADYQDLYRERLRRTGAGVEALGPDGVWHRTARHTEVVEVAGEEPVEVEVIETERGPVIIGGPEGLPERLPEGSSDEPFGGLSGEVVAGLGTGQAEGLAVAPFGEWPKGPSAESTAGLAEGRFDELAKGLAGGPFGESAAGLPGEPSHELAAGLPEGPSDEPFGGPFGESAAGLAAVRLGESSEGPAPGTPLAVSLRYPPRVTADLGFGALLPLLRARRVADVDRAVDLWAEPVNVVQAADTEGGVLHRVAGKVPVRSAANRVRLVPAWEPGHDWHGWHEPPRAGLVDGVAVMANQRGLATPLGVEFAPPHRADRIAELLAGEDRWSAAGMQAIHMDTRLASAAPLLDRLAAAQDLTPRAEHLRRTLLAWDRRMDASSEAAAVYAAVRGAVVRRLAAHPAFAALAVTPAYPDVLLPWLALVPRVGFSLEHLLRAEELYGIDRTGIVRAAIEEVADRPPTGTWGDTHRLAPWRALAEAGPAGDDEPGPGLSGDHDCVLCTSAVPGVTDLSARGPSARYVWDLADRENSRWVVPLGVSGVPGSPHCRDQLPLWLKGDLVPVVTDWDLLEKETDV